MHKSTSQVCAIGAAVAGLLSCFGSGALAATASGAQPVMNAQTGSSPVSAPANRGPTAASAQQVAVASAPTASTPNVGEEGSVALRDGIAAIGLFLGVINLGLYFYKTKRDRRLSVEDDFWFRKVVSPAAIEPLIKAVSELLIDLPADRADIDGMRDYAVRVTKDFQRIYGSVQMLGMLDLDLPTDIATQLRGCEDILTDYIGQLADAEANANRQEAVSESWRVLNATLTVIKNRQLKH